LIHCVKPRCCSGSGKSRLLGYLPQDSHDSLASASAHLDGFELLATDQATTEGLIDSLSLQLGRKVSLDNHVDECSQGGSNVNPVDRVDVALGQARSVQPEHFRDRRHALKTGRDRHMQLRRHRVRQFVQCQCRRVTEHPLQLILAVA